MMKEGWERTEPAASLDLRKMNEIIQPAFPGKRIIAAERLGTGFSNANYKFQLEGSSRSYVLRIFSGGAEVADKEHAIAELVRHSVPVADFIDKDTSCRTYEKCWAVLEWKEGVLLRDVVRTGNAEELASAAASVGSVLARIHRFTFPESGFFGKNLGIVHPYRMDGEHFITFMEQSLFHNQSGKWLGEALTDQLWSFCLKYRSLLAENSGKPVLVHSDFNGLNLLMQHGPAGYEVSAVLDWEFAFSWRRHVDIANMLRYEEEGSIFEQHFIEAYQEHGVQLEDDWKLLSKLEDLVALCDMLNNSTLDTPNRIRDLQRLIEGTVRRYG
ncbi:phosphotransferase family protein [Paenibacillus spongiae]|uniref:Aminoglycoside phosphotransferase family protein n=1 Tax=Paenibacillus spongiae TaxID=2909671 RepID=A0ABY5S660_9BACL|nr:aminoglycoside phosphotransferase family protein [Paenibacillus spongiae]UVI29194.1 aminoglycoside phosphotransferase family protein [Paenibacillus spongiae]